ncbi:MAG: hypothetical protein HQL15_10445, partial [Candidatus Omnitrophica bacterium]|nr:hypothetical protein [Candidatus Omnitrophota bacterium]
KTPKDLIYGSLKGLLSSLDPHSQFLDPDDYNDLKTETAGKFGYTLTPPTEDKHYMSKGELKGIMTVLLGGMVGEEIYMNDTTTGVSNDLQKVSQIARSMVCVYGMSNKLDKLAFGKQGGQQMFLGRDLFDEKNYSEETARKIDEEIHNLVHESYDRAKSLLLEHRAKLELLSKRLIEKETLDIEEVRELLNLPENKLNLHHDAPNTNGTAGSTTASA